MRVTYQRDSLEAPTVLRNPVPVDALYDPQAANQAIFHNLLQRQGYEGIDAILAEGKAEGKARGKLEGLAEGETSGRLQALKQALFLVVVARGLHLTNRHEAHVEDCTDPGLLSQWLRNAATATSAAEIFLPVEGSE